MGPECSAYVQRVFLNISRGYEVATRGRQGIVGEYGYACIAAAIAARPSWEPKYSSGSRSSKFFPLRNEDGT